MFLTKLWELWSGIRILILYLIPDPGVKKAPDPWSGSAKLSLITISFFLCKIVGDPRHLDADPHLTFPCNTDPDPPPSSTAGLKTLRGSLWASTAPEWPSMAQFWASPGFCIWCGSGFRLLTLVRIRFRLSTSMMRIRFPNMMRSQIRITASHLWSR